MFMSSTMPAYAFSYFLPVVSLNRIDSLTQSWIYFCPRFYLDQDILLRSRRFYLFHHTHLREYLGSRTESIEFNIFRAIYTFAVAYGADKSRRRALFIILNSLVCTVGLLITAYAKPRNARYFGWSVPVATSKLLSTDKLSTLVSWRSRAVRPIFLLHLHIKQIMFYRIRREVWLRQYVT